MNNRDFIDKAKYIVATYINRNILDPKEKMIDTSDILVTWYAKTLQNHKALLSTSLKDDQYYFEVTYNGDKKQLYLDVYVKQENQRYAVIE